MERERQPQEQIWRDYGSFNLYPEVKWNDQANRSTESQVSLWEQSLSPSLNSPAAGRGGNGAAVLKSEFEAYLKYIHANMRPDPKATIFDLLPILTKPFAPGLGADGKKSLSLLSQVAAAVPIKSINPLLKFANEYDRNPRAITIGDSMQFVSNLESFTKQCSRFTATTSQDKAWEEVISFLKHVCSK